jgi:hypothetical protein
LYEFNNTGNSSGEPVWRLNSSIIAEFLFTQAPKYLTNQDFYAPDKQYDQELADVISVLMGVKKDLEQDSPLSNLKLAFQSFLNTKRESLQAETNKNSHNMTKNECQLVVEDFLLDDSLEKGEQDIDDSKIPILTNAFFNLEKIPDDEDLNTRFYRYVIDKKPELKHPILLASILSPETDDDKKILINSVEPNFPDNLKALFTSRKKNLAEEFSKFLLARYNDELRSIASLKNFIKEFTDLNSQKTREFLKFVFGTITPEIYETLKFKLEFENKDQEIEFLKYKLKQSIKITDDAIDTENLNLTKILREAKIDLDEVFLKLGLLDKLLISIDGTEDNVYLASPELNFILLEDKSFVNYLKEELVLAELLKQMSPNEENKFSRIIECYNDNNPEDTRILIVKFVNSYTLKHHFIDPKIKKPSLILDYKTFNFETFNKNKLLKNKLFNTIIYELKTLPYLQYDNEQFYLLISKLSNLENSINERLNRAIFNSLALVLTHCYIAFKPTKTPRDFLIEIFEELLSKSEGALIYKINNSFKNLTDSFNARHRD